MRRLLLLGLALLSATPVCVYALSLGNIELKSGLHQPLDARIPILSASADEIETLHVGVAPVAEFNRAGVNYAGILTQLKFDIQHTRNGPDYIRITSHDSVNEPFLNFLVEADWAKGRLIREFTALLDPPLYDPSRRVAWEPAKIKSSSPVTPATTQPAPASGRELVANAPAPAAAPVAKEKPAAKPTAPVQTAAVPAAAPASTSSTPTSGAFPTLWSAAAAMRPSNTVSMQQMMVALLRTNPDAFIRGNMNLLKKGYVLKMPEQSALTATSRAEALAEFQRHDALWREYRERGAQAAPHQPKGGTSVAAAQPESTGSSSETKPETPAGPDASKLKLLAGNDATGKNAAANAGDLALTKEALESKNRENEELKSQLKESEDIIDKLKSRITLQDSQLADLQTKLGANAGKAAETAPTPAPAPAAETTAPTETAAAAPLPTAPAQGAPEAWRSLDNEVQKPTYPFPNTSAEAPAAAETTPPAEAPTPPAEQVPPSQGTAVPSESPPKATAEAPPAEAPTVETPPATAPPPEQGASAEPNKAAEQPPAAAGSTESAAPAATETPPAPEQPAAPAEEKPAAAEQPAPAAAGGIVEKINALFGKFIPTSLLDSIPGGGLTLAGGLLALLGGLGALVMRRRAAPVADGFPTVAEDEPVSSFDSALSGATSASAVAPGMDDEDLFGVPDDHVALDHGEPTSVFDRTTSVQAPTTPLREDAEEDPLAEVNVYLAYERFDEAERLIREAIANHPNEHKYKLRLLEVYYSSNNRPAYEQAARELHDAVGGAGPLWDSALAMWREMSPNRELFSAGGDLASTLGEGGQKQFVDITALGEEAISRTVTSAVVPGISTLGESATATTNTQVPSDDGFFDPGAATDQAFDMLDITAAGDVKQTDTDILDLSANPASSIGEDASMVEGASEAVNELLSLTKSGSVVGAPGANLMESSLDFDTGFMGDQPGSASSTMSPSDLLDFDLGGADATMAKPGDNVVDFPARTEAANPVDSLTTMIDVAPMGMEPPPSLSASAAPKATVGETSMGLEASAGDPGLEFDIGGLDLSLDIGAQDETRGPESTGVDMKLDTRGSAEVTMGDIDSLSLDEDTVRLFENDLASTNAQDTAPIFGSDGDLTATGGDFGAFDEAFRDSTAAGGDELTLDTDTDNLTLDDITKSLEDTVGAKSKSRYESSFETVDLTMDSKEVLDSEQTAELFENDLRGASAEETFSATSTLGTVAGDDIDTKLNLAKAYIELGDASGARSILDEVVREGIDAQRDEANRLLRELST